MSRDDQSFDQAARGKQRGFWAEGLHFMLHNKKWWLAPIILIMLLVSALVILGGTGAAPFIYSLF